VDKDFFTIVICFDPPTRELWYFDDTVLSIEHVINTKGPLITVKANTGRADGFNCVDIAYPINSILSSGKAKLSIGKLVTDFHGNCDRAQRNLDASAAGIVISCDPARVARDTGMGHTAGYVVLKKPVFMNEVEAYMKAWDAFSDIKKVDWRFTFDIEKP
jgi:hypothetical protein